MIKRKSIWKSHNRKRYDIESTVMWPRATIWLMNVEPFCPGEVKIVNLFNK